MPSKVKITVIRKMSTKDVYGEELPTQLAKGFFDKLPKFECPRLNVGDDFVVREDGSCPDGFCGWAFADIQRDITHLRHGGSYPECEHEGTWICCCTEGLFPVFFKLETMK